MIYYTINHYVTTDDSTDPAKSTVYGDNALCVWESDDYATTAPDYRHDQPNGGVDMAHKFERLGTTS